MNSSRATCRRSRCIRLGLFRWVFLFFTTLATARATDNCLKLSSVFTSYDALRQGETYDMRITLHTSGCLVALNQGDDLQPLVQAKDGPGLKFRVVGVGSMRIERLSRVSAVRYGARERSLDLRVTSDPDTAIGLQHALLLLNYETIDQQGRQTPQSVDIDLPLKIVGPNAPVKRQWDAPKWNPLQILLIPIRLVELMFWDGC